MRRWNRTVLLMTLVLMGLVWGVSAWALSLDEAKAKGLVGEKPSGYLGVVSGGADVQALVNDINQKRRQAYGDIASRNKTDLKDVETLAGEKAIQNTKPGHFVQSPSGQWMKK
ncbi:MAG: YdbL family protein [Nitrospiraceae bacterium]